MSRFHIALSIPAPSMPRYLIMLFACASGLSVANVYYAQPLLDSLASEFAISHAAVGGVITATQFGSALALLLIVPLGDVLSRKKLMMAQLATLVLTLIGVSLAVSSMMLLLGMLAVGLLGTAMTQGLIAYAATSAAPTERGRIVGAAQGGVVIGLLSARVLAGFIADLAGWRAVYLLSAMVMLALGIILWRVLPTQTRSLQRLSYAALIMSMFTFLRVERVLQIRGVIALLMFAAFNIFWSALVLLLSAPPYSFSHSVIGAFGLVGVVGALAASRAGSWADRGLGQLISGIALLLLIISWVPIWYSTHTLYFLVIGIILLDLGGQAIHVTSQSMILNTQTNAHSRIVGCYMLFYTVGSGLGAIISTTVYASSGWWGVCLLGSGVSGLALMFWLLTLQFMPKNC
jgi:predicted MFS family arabinose efflux permease